MTKSNNICDTCTYCVVTMTNKQLSYVCKRYPPAVAAFPVSDKFGQMGISVMCTRPQVTKDDFCGEYVEKPVPLALVN